MLIIRGVGVVLSVLIMGVVQAIPYTSMIVLFVSDVRRVEIDPNVRGSDRGGFDDND